LQISCQDMEFVIISDRKTISPRFSYSLSGLKFIFNHYFSSTSLFKCDRGSVRSEIRKLFGSHHFFNLKNFVTIRTGQFLSQCVDGAFKSTKKLGYGILGFLNESKIPGHCRFSLGNTHSGESVYCVPAYSLHEPTVILLDSFS